MLVSSEGQKKLSTGGTKFFEQLFKSEYAKLCYYASQIVKDSHAAEDIVQNAFIKIWGKEADFSNEMACKGFLYTTIRNAALNFIRHKKVEDKYLEAQEINPVEETKILNSIIRAEVVGEIFRALESLPEGCKKVFKMSYLEELKNQEIADKLQLSINTVKTQKARAVQLLRIKLKDYFQWLIPLLLIKAIP